MNPIEVVLLQFDGAWSHDWESLRSALEGLSEEEANWQAPCYRSETAAGGWPLPGSVRWQVAHVAHYKREYAARLGSDPEAGSPDLPHRPSMSFAEDLAELHAAHAAQRTAIERLDPGALTPAVAEFLSNTIRHDSWHAGQIAIARRLYRERERGRE